MTLARRHPTNPGYIGRDFAHQQLHGPGGKINWRKAGLSIGLPLAGIAVGCALIFHSHEPKTEALRILPLSSHELLLSRTRADFEAVLNAPKTVEPAALLKEIGNARAALTNFNGLKKGEQAIAIAQLGKDNSLANRRIIITERPEPGDAKTSKDRGFSVRRAYGQPKEVPLGVQIPREDLDPSGSYSQLKISRRGAPDETWVALAVKLFVVTSTHGSRFFIVTPYCEQLASGDMAKTGLAYLSEVDTLMRGAILDYSGNARACGFLGKVPNNMNVLISLIEQIGPENLGNGTSMRRAISRLLYHVATNGAESKLLTVSSAGARGMVQVMPKTRKDLFKNYGIQKVFDRWALASNYRPRWSGEKTSSGDIYSSLMMANFHHIDVLGSLETIIGTSSSEMQSKISEVNARISELARKKQTKETKRLLHSNKILLNTLSTRLELITLLEEHGMRDPLHALYSSELQTTCALAAGYNGGAQAVVERMLEALQKDPASPWHETSFQRATEDMEELMQNIRENVGYVVKATVASNSLQQNMPDSQHIPNLHPFSKDLPPVQMSMALKEKHAPRNLPVHAHRKRR
ncbi:Uncharacterised protein [Candidatus Anstonella stagnisolia]|nr:Uncharacterised protein [Candidatus Anstonella stagnisolia]